MSRRFRPKGPPLLETEVAEKVVAWLEAERWDVYQEVDEIDIVAVRGSLLWAVECKTSMGFDVLEQALSRRSLVNGIWIASPPRAKSRAARLSCSSLGIGWMTVSRNYLNVECYPAFQRKTVGKLRERLRPEHKTYSKAGSPTGKRWTPFKETCRDLLRVVSASPGISLSDALRAFKHHYKNDASARRSLVDFIANGIVPGVRLTTEDGTISLFPISPVQSSPSV